MCTTYMELVYPVIIVYSCTRVLILVLVLIKYMCHVLLLVLVLILRVFLSTFLIYTGKTIVIAITIKLLKYLNVTNIKFFLFQI